MTVEVKLLVENCSLEDWLAEVVAVQAWCPRMNSVPMYPDSLYSLIIMAHNLLVCNKIILDLL